MAEHRDLGFPSFAAVGLGALAESPRPESEGIGDRWRSPDRACKVIKPHPQTSPFTGGLDTTAGAGQRSQSPPSLGLTTTPPPPRSFSMEKLLPSGTRRIHIMIAICYGLFLKG